jgi:hypothetical protein
VADTGNGESYLLLSAKGTNSVSDIAYEGIKEGDVYGSFRGISLSPEDWDSETGKYLTMNVGRVEGDMSGFYEAGVDTTIQAAFVGQWVDLAELSTDVLGFDNEAIAAMVQVPITETYSALLTQTGSSVTGGTIYNMAMDMSIYSTITSSPGSLYTGQAGGIYADGSLVGVGAASSAAGDILTAYITGNYTGTPAAGWSVNLAEPGYSAILNNGTWNNDSWAADLTVTKNP